MGQIWLFCKNYAKKIKKFKKLCKNNPLAARSGGNKLVWDLFSQTANTL